MTREEIRDDILGLESKCILVELPTSVGKSKIALDFMNERKITGEILIAIPRLVLINNWKEEFKKWGYEEYLKNVTFTTYVSLPKHATKHFELIIFDECHHLSERAREAVEEIISDYQLLLSATVNRNLKKEIKLLFPHIACYKLSMREAINDSVLPDPRVFLVPLTLNTKDNTELLVINPSVKGKVKTASFAQRFMARKDKSTQYRISCTQSQYYQDASSMVDFYKKKYFATNNQIMYFRWQKAAKDRLVWLSSIKNPIATRLLRILNNKRTLTFCNGIEQTEQLGKYCINSKNNDSEEFLNKFNKGKVNHITACNMLNEGINLTNCQVGIFVSINSSETMLVQKMGRILRHQNPIIILLYYKDTREEEIVSEMLDNYNKELITVVTNKQQLDEIDFRQ